MYKTASQIADQVISNCMRKEAGIRDMPRQALDALLGGASSVRGAVGRGAAGVRDVAGRGAAGARGAAGRVGEEARAAGRWTRDVADNGMSGARETANSVGQGVRSGVDRGVAGVQDEAQHVQALWETDPNFRAAVVGALSGGAGVGAGIGGSALYNNLSDDA